jgi:NAD+ synthase
MPAPRTGREAIEDAAETAELLGIRIDTIPIEPAIKAFETMWMPAFAGRDHDRAEAGGRARARGTILRALAVEFDALVLSTADRTALAIGQEAGPDGAAGDYAVLKDIYRTGVRALARWRNQALPEGARGPAGRVVPERVVDRAHEMGAGRAHGIDADPDPDGMDPLPPQEALDDILASLVDLDLGLPDVVARGHDAEDVARVWRLHVKAEARRRQAPLGPIIGPRASGTGRLPVTNAFAEPS